MARYFPGARTAYLKITDTVDLETYPCTMTAWGKFDGAGLGSYGTIFGRYEENTVDDRRLDTMIIDNASGVIRAQGIRTGQPGGGSYSIVGGAGDTNWHHVALVMYGNAHRSFYIDGVLVGSNSFLCYETYDLLCLGVGAITILPPPDEGGYVLKGAVADCAMWTTALSPYEIQQLASKQLRPGQIKRNQLKGWWPLTQGGDLNSVVPYLPFTQFGAVTEVADPPSLPPIEVPPTEYERDLVYLRDVSPERDALMRGLRGWLPMSEMYQGSTGFITDSINRYYSIPALPPRSTLGAYPDGGVLIGAGATPNYRDYDVAAVTPPMTLSVWLRNYNSGGSGVALIVFPTYSYWQGLYCQPAGTDMVFHHVANNFALVETLTASATFFNTKWTHYVYTLTSTYRTLHADGRLVGQSNVTVPIGATPWTHLRLWTDMSGTNPLTNVSMRDLRTWNRVLNDREIVRLYAQGYAVRGRT